MKRFFHVVLVLSLVLIGLSATVSAQAKKGAPTRTAAAAPTYRYAHEHGYRAGYEDGYVRGKSDFNDARDRDVESSEAYRRANRTYEPKQGSLPEYQHGYHIGFELGYDDGYFGRAYTTAIPPNLGRTWSVANQPVVVANQNDEPRRDTNPAQPVYAPSSRPEPIEQPAPVDRTTNQGRRQTDDMRTSSSRDRLVVRDGIQLKVRLQTPINTKTNREGDQFTAVVLDPSEYADALITGHIAKLKSSGKMTGKTELVLAFDEIELRNGNRGRFAAQVEKVYQTDSVKEVDEEGNVVSGDRTKDTAVRTGGGAVLGAILGGVAGGGKGAAIGAAIGGAVGAGSVIYQGSKDLQLDPGTEMLIRTAAPARTRE
jgi:hypothetical protein